MQQQMSLNELSRYIQNGDVINGKHVVTKHLISFAYCGEVKFDIATYHGNGRINTVARDGEIYFSRLGWGGYRNRGKNKKEII